MTILQRNKNADIGKRLGTVAEIAAVHLSGEKTDEPLCAIDVGTDHALLPIYLVKSGICRHVTATDINEGPVRNALSNIGNAGKEFEEKIDVICTDGLSGLENIPCDRIIIAGMGGELIRDILIKAPFVREGDKKGKIKFILQPQTRSHLLRKYLYDCGYGIIDERILSEGGKTYQVMAAVYDGIPKSHTVSELYFGKLLMRENSPLFRKYYAEKYKILEKNINSRKGRTDVRNTEVFAEEEILFSEMTEYIKKNGADFRDENIPGI